MERERIRALRTIIGQIDTISDQVNGHLEAVRGRVGDLDDEDTTQHLEFAFAELRAARRELTEATEEVIVPAA